MADKMKFQVNCIMDGSSWYIEVEEGYYLEKDGKTIVHVKSGKRGQNSIANKKFVFPADKCVIEEND